VAPAQRDEIAVLRREVAAFAALAGVSDDDRAALQVAVSEALSNAVMHAYRDRDFAGDVCVDAEICGCEFHVRVRDYGVGMSARPDSPGMGLGLSMIARLAKRHSVHRCDGGAGGTEIGMCFDLLPEGHGAH
jgi:anti-sigma regulatory factor (Ser/Thr protein kinase)